ncbi:MAG: MFS transporter [Planctomycetes bacterium]|nr:MFS transporter [Planctomycetota bacterium]
MDSNESAFSDKAPLPTPSSPIVPEPKSLDATDWLILIIASIGFAFDIYELLMLPLVVPSALEEFGFRPGTPEFNDWVGRLFYIPAFVGGVCGLLGGYLTDRLGRRSVLTWSILCYAISAFLAGFATGPWTLLIFRTTTFIGVCVEFVAAIAWLAELFPNPHQREQVLGYTQAFSSIGGLLVASANSLANHLEEIRQLPAVLIPEFLASIIGQVSQGDTATLAWRYTLMSGLIPAIPLILIRPFLPESPAWAKKVEEGTLKRPSFGALFSPELIQTTLIAMVMFACVYGAAFGAIQQLSFIVPGLKDDVAEAKEKIKKLQEKKRADNPDDPRFAKVMPDARMEKLAERKLYSDYNKVQEIGGLLGRFAFALIAVWFISRRNLLRVFQIPGLLLMPVFFYFIFSIENTKYFEIPLGWLGIGALPVTNVSLGVMFAGFVTVAQMSFWGNFLPTAYPLHLRGTGESFAANIGGRVIGTSFAWVTGMLAAQDFMPGSPGPEKFASAAAAVALFVYAVGSIACFFLPEPEGEMVD